MSRIFISGSTTGLGRLAGERLLDHGHHVILHARNAERAAQLRRGLPGQYAVVIGDLSSIAQTLSVANQLGELEPIDAAIHNAGVGYGGSVRRTEDDLPDTFAVNVLAPFILTARLPAPRRLVYLSSSMHRARPDWDDLFWRRRSWNGSWAYSESKFLVTALALAVARLRPEVRANAVDPGWVPTRMGGAGAPDDLEAGTGTQVALVDAGDGPLAEVSGRYLHHMSFSVPAEGTMDTHMQDRLLKLCGELSGLSLVF